MNPPPALPPRPISPFVSPSKSDALAECPHRYWRQQLHPAPDTREQQIGNAFHEFAPLYVKCLILGGGRASMPEVVPEVLKACNSERWNPDWRAECEALCRAMARDWQMPAGFVMLGSEFEWALRPDGSATLNYTDPLAIARGKIDLPGMVQPDSWLWLFDWKTGAWDPEEIAVDRQRIPKGRQARWYLYAASRIWQADNYVWATFHPRLGKQYTATVKRSQIERAADKILAEMQQEFDDLKLRLAMDKDGKPADAWPATPCKWCPTCQFGPEPGKGDDSCPHFNAQQRGVSELRDMLRQGKGSAQAQGSISETQTQGRAVEESQVQGQGQGQPQGQAQELTPDDLAKSIRASELTTVEPAAAPEPIKTPVPTGWEVSNAARAPRWKILLIGKHGTFKTRSILTAFADRHSPSIARPRLALADTEDGSEHYLQEFLFYRKKISDKNGIDEQFFNPPEGVETIGIDSITDYCQMVFEWWTELYRVRERGAGNKVEYYTLQPRDHANPKAEIRRAILRGLIDSPLNFIITAKTKSLFADGELMKKIGEQMDGYDRIPYFMDTVISLAKDDATGNVLATTEKDRSHKFPVGTRWIFTPESFASIVNANRPATSNVTPAQVQIDPELAQFTLLATAKEASRIDQPSYLAIVSRIGQGATSAKQLTPSQRNELIEELEEIAANLPF